jgi:hypothetical protein
LVIQELIDEFRASYVMSSLRLSSRLLMLSMGENDFKNLLRRFWAGSLPSAFASEEGKAFAQFLKLQVLEIPYLGQVIEFDLAMLAAWVRAGCLSTLKKENMSC